MRRAALLAVVLFASVPVLAEPPAEDVLRPDLPTSGGFYIEPHAGINLSFLDGNDATRSRIAGENQGTLYESGSGIAPLVGITLGYELSHSFALRFDLSYDARSAGNDGTTTDTCFTGGTARIPRPLEVAKDYEVDVTYLSLSALASFTFDRVVIFAGPSVGLPVARSVEESIEVAEEETGCYYFSETPEATPRVEGALSDQVAGRLRVALKLGAGVTIPIGDRLELVPTLAYDLGLDAMFTPGDDDGRDYLFRGNGGTSAQSMALDFNEAVRLSSLQASVGLRIRL